MHETAQRLENLLSTLGEGNVVENAERLSRDFLMFVFLQSRQDELTVNPESVEGIVTHKGDFIVDFVYKNGLLSLMFTDKMLSYVARNSETDAALNGYLSYAPLFRDEAVSELQETIAEVGLM